MRTKKGIITSAKAANTVTVTVHESTFHPVYKKRFRRSKKFMADTNNMDLYEGDLVVITECRPLSKRKHFKVTEIVEQAPRVDDVQEEKDLSSAVAPEKVAPPIAKKDDKKAEKKEGKAEAAADDAATDTDSDSSDSSDSDSDK